MSRLSDVDEPKRKSKPTPFVLRRRRRKPLHPEQVHALLREKASARKSKPLGPTPYGWTIKLYEHDGAKPRRRHTTADASYQDAVEIRDEEMASGDYAKAWIERKTEPRK